MKREINITVTVDVPEEPTKNQTLSAYTLPISEVGYMVVDLTWKRTLHFGNDKWLSTSSTEYPITVFKTEKDAEAAIEATRNFENKKGSRAYSWQDNDYRVIEVNDCDYPRNYVE